MCDKPKVGAVSFSTMQMYHHKAQWIPVAEETETDGLVAGLSSLVVPPPGRELQGAFRSVETCCACSDPIPAPPLEAAQWSNRAAQQYPKCHKQRLWKRVVDSAESRQLTSSLKKAASLCCSE